MKPIRIVLADDHPMMRAGIRAMLQEVPEAEVVGEAGDGHEALAQVEKLRPHLLLTDVAMPGLNGLDLAARLAKDLPEVRVIVLSMHASEQYVRRAMQAGAAGYVLKDAGPEELRLAVAAVARGESYLSPAISKQVISGYLGGTGQEPTSLERLTPRQREVLQLIAEGLRTKEIAKKLGISSRTVETYRAQLMEQLAIRDVAGLVRYAISAGLVQPDT